MSSLSSDKAIHPSGSHGEILKNSSIIGGSAAINIVVGLARTKAAAVFLGPEGVGLMGLYQNAVNMVGTVSGMGIASSGVREIASAVGGGDLERIGQTVRTLRRVCWLTGFGGWLLAASLAVPISNAVFHSREHALAIALLGFTLLLTQLSAGQKCLVQGYRRIGDLARIGVFSALSSAMVSIALFAWLGSSGILPALLASSVVSLLVSWTYSRRVAVPASPTQTWRESIAASKPLLGLGLAFMWTAFLTSASTMVTNAAIIRDFGLEANGIYLAAWNLSGMFASFILTAMAADYYPRLTAASGDDSLVRSLVNDQTEIGVILALPGLVATLIYAPLIIKIFYTREFLLSAELLPILVVGIFAQVISWPMGFIMLAKGRSKLFAIFQTIASLTHLGLTLLLLHSVGIFGVAIAFLSIHLFNIVVQLVISKRIASFTWSRSIITLLLSQVGLICVALGIRYLLPGQIGIWIGIPFVLLVSVFCGRSLFARVGSGHKLAKLAAKLPGGRCIFGLKSPDITYD